MNQLIEEFCHDGVKYIPLEQCCKILDNKRKPVTKSQRENGEYPYYGANGIQDYVSEYIFDGAFVLVGEDGSVITPAGTPVVTWATGKIWVNNHAHVIEEKEGVRLRYLFHYLQTVNIKPLIHGNIPKLTGRDFKAIRVPVPPLSVQDEVVALLDNFMNHSTKLTSDLALELTFRKQQYEYYRDMLLTFGDDVPVRKFGELASVMRGASPRPIKKYVTKEADGVCWIKIGDVETGSKYITHTNEKITKAGAAHSRYVHRGDFVLSNSMSFGRPYILAIDGCIHDGWLAISDFEENYTSDFLYHLISSTTVQNAMSQRAAFGGAVQNLNSDIVKGLEFPVPSLSKQQRIVAILDNYDKLCNSVNESLAAEIKARQQQYEYYRDKLLTFKEKEVSVNE
ncbi:MAG: restriction endonuclease subunit S [Eubacteriales bacterium]|nr:restriction endonuclease subunit S [Eubacteriales bacterium]